MSSCGTGEIPEFLRESKELVAFTVTDVEGNAVDVADVLVCVRPDGERPPEWDDTGSWSAPDEVGEKYGVIVSDLTLGAYRGYARVDRPPQTPVIDCGLFRVV